MANHGGLTSLPRAHRPRAPIMNIPPITAPLAPLRPAPPVTLTVPRPENERASNEYVETPFKVSPPPTAATPSTTTPPHHPPRRPTRLVLPTISKQPAAAAATTTSSSAAAAMAATFSKEPPPECATRPSIMCPECGRCRCESCQLPRALPQKWVCDNSCLVSADSVIDYASCLCCVKGLFYHCSDTDGGESCADDPCGCGPDRRTARWSCLATLSCVLPCLWLYWPLRGCKRAVEACYARHSRTGCRCRPSLPTPEKRLLDSSSDF